MNVEWGEISKKIQALLGKKSSYKEGIDLLIEFRGQMFWQVENVLKHFPDEAFYQMPFAGAKGYHSKTIAYSVWHIFRIEDIVAHTLILGDEQVLFSDGFDKMIGADIFTTGNELQGEEIAAFSKKLNVKALCDYARAVMDSTNDLLRSLDYADFKRRFNEADRERVADSGCVSSDEEAFWLVDYWCGKDVLGLIKMPFSRHWIMHIEAMQRIKNRLCKKARKGVDPVAYCGFSCNHCFLGEWCGSCRTDYNTCSFATCFEDRACPNVTCCKEKGIDGCYECDELEGCRKGFYIEGNDGAAAAKAQAMYIKKHGKKAFLKVHDILHEKYDFAKTQEILGQDALKGLDILEKESGSVDLAEA